MSRRLSSTWLAPLAAFALLWPLAHKATNETVFRAFNHFASTLPDTLWSCLTVTGDTLVVLCLLIPFLRRRPDLVVAALLAAVPATAISHGLKDAFEIMRPLAVLGEQVHLVGHPLKAGSFPSGHATTLFTLATILMLGLRCATARTLALAAATLAALSRVAVGAHWPLDIVGGVLCGWLSGAIGMHLVERHPALYRRATMEVVRMLLLACAVVLLVDFDSGYPLARPFERSIALAVLIFHLMPGWRLYVPIRKAPGPPRWLSAQGVRLDAGRMSADTS